MFKVLVWDYTGISAQWLEQVADMKDIEVVGTIKPKEHVPDIFFDTDEWDWLLIFEQGMRDFFNTAIRISRLPPERVIYALDIVSWIKHPKAAFALTDMQWAAGSNIFFNMHWAISRQLNKFVTCTVDGINYIGTSKDLSIMWYMYTNRVNFAVDDMKVFHTLAKKYYNVDDGAGYFLDLGANIGTTGLYFTTKLAPNLKLLAVEPDPENFKLHQINLLLNEIGDDKATLINCGLGDKADEMTMYRDLRNPGHNNFTEPKTGVPTETVKIMPLDACLAEKQIAAREVKYIWIDTEGFEAQVLLGAKKLLRENPAPIFMECNLSVWENSGRLDEMLALLAEGYSHLIHVAGSKIDLYPLDAIRTVGNPKADIGGNGDIFLIRKGAIV